MPKILHQRGKNASTTQRVFIAVPTYNGAVGAAFSIGMFEAIQILEVAGISVDYCIETGNCHVDDARNALVREFLKTDCTDFVFIDEDVGFNGADLYRMLKYDEDIVAGIYPCKQDEEEFPVQYLDKPEVWSDERGLIEVDAVPTGFLRMRRKVLETMIAKFGDRKFFGRGQEGQEPHYILFERTYENTTRYSGDYSFCRKWRSIGGKIFVDPSFVFSHTGEKSWKGSLGKHLKDINGVTKSELRACIEQIKSGVFADSVFNEIFELWGNPYSAPPALLKEIYFRSCTTTDAVLECGSGLSTIVIAAAGKDVLSLENDPVWFGKVSAALVDFELNYNVNLVYSPIIEYDGFSWYSHPKIYTTFGLVVCDGPERKYGREGLFKVMTGIQGATMIIDDTEDPEQMRIAQKYCENVKSFNRFSTGTIK